MSFMNTEHEPPLAPLERVFELLAFVLITYVCCPSLHLKSCCFMSFLFQRFPRQFCLRKVYQCSVMLRQQHVSGLDLLELSFLFFQCVLHSVGDMSF